MDKHANTVPTETPCISCGLPSTCLEGGRPYCDSCVSEPNEKVANLYEPNDPK